MDYAAILKRSWEIIKKRRWLWWLGLLAGITEGGSVGLTNYNSFGSGGDFTGFMPSPSPVPSPSPSPIVTPETAATPVTDALSEASKLVGDAPVGSDTIAAIGAWLATNWPLVAGMVIIFIILWLVMLYISYAAKAGLVRSVHVIEDDQKDLGFRAAFQQGRPFAWRLFGLSILVSLATLALVLVIGIIFAAPSILGFITMNPIAIILSVLWGIIGFVLLFVLTFAVGIIRQLADQAMITEELGVMAAFRSGQELLRKQFGKAVITALVTFGIAFAYVFIVMIIIVPLLLLVFGIGVGVYAAGGVVATVVYGVIAFILLLIFSFIIGGVYVSYYLTYWTLAYRAIRYLHKHGHKGHKEEA